MTLKMMGKKIGMTRLFDAEGNLVVCSVISAEPNVITQVKTKETDGYTAVQLGAFKQHKKQNVSKPQQGHFAKANVEPRKRLRETRLESVDGYTVGQEIDVNHFADVRYVDIRGVSKGKGHQGVIKRHHFAGGPASHGSGFHRHGGSTGMRTSPGRCLPGQKKSGHMGDEVVTVQNLEVVKVDSEKQVIIVKGAIPGARGGLLYIMKAKKITK
ncbi:MAG: 50S ribosomal protein L3 [Chlamydiales bacterium]|nr:50S ribosomal protein L3 [Chlamydiales bacterium]